MIVADSIGFAATHTISNILAELPGYRVTHGSQNFDTGGPLGTPGQTPAGFVDSMRRADAAGERPVALHTNFDPRQFLPACAAAGVKYELLVRRPAAQIESCFAWAMKKVLEGDDQVLLIGLKTMLQPFNAAGIRSSLPNLVYGYALHHVCVFNLAALEAGAEVVRMEDLLSDEAAFRATFEVPDVAEIAHFSGDAKHLASHRAQKGLDLVAEPDRDAIMSALTVSAGGAPHQVADLTRRFGYDA